MESMHTDIRVLRVRCFSAPVSAGHKMIHFMFVLIIFFKLSYHDNYPIKICVISTSKCSSWKGKN